MAFSLVRIYHIYFGLNCMNSHLFKLYFGSHSTIMFVVSCILRDDEYLEQNQNVPCYSFIISPAQAE